MSRVFPAPGSGERDESCVLAVEKLYDLPELALAAEEGGGRNRKVRPIEALQGGELSVAELEDALRGTEILEPVLAEVGELGVDKRRGSRRDKHLAAVARGGDTSCPVDVVADVTLLSDERRSRMDSDADTYRPVAARRSVKSEAAARAPGAVGNAKKKASPCVSTSTPLLSAHASRIAVRCATSASAYALRAEFVSAARSSLRCR